MALLFTGNGGGGGGQANQVLPVQKRGGGENDSHAS